MRDHNYSRRLLEAGIAAIVGVGVVFVGTIGPAAGEGAGDSDRAVKTVKTARTGGDGDSVNQPRLTETEKARAKAKESVADAYRAVKDGNGSTGLGENLTGLGKHLMAPQATRNSVDVDQKGQIKSWWCGPAVAGMIIRQLKSNGVIRTTTSRLDPKHTLSQPNLARPAYMNAVNDGTYRTDMKRGLNRWTNTRYPYAVTSNPTVQRFRNSVLFDIDQIRSAIAVAALEFGNTPRYNGHPSNQTVDHWVVAFGYSGRGGWTKFADSATTLWSSVRPKFRFTTKTFVQRYVQPAKAIVW